MEEINTITNLTNVPTKLTHSDREKIIDAAMKECTEDEFRNVLYMTALYGPKNNIIREELLIEDTMMVSQLRDVIDRYVNKKYNKNK